MTARDLEAEVSAAPTLPTKPGNASVARGISKPKLYTVEQTDVSAPDLEADSRNASREIQETEILETGMHDLVDGERQMPDAALAIQWRIRSCIASLVTLGAMRFFAASTRRPPMGSAWTSQMMSCGSDTMGFMVSLAIVDSGLIGSCVRHRYLSCLHMLMLISTALDLSAIVIFVYSVGTDASLLNVPLVVELARSCDLWQTILWFSLCVQMCMCYTAWMFYRALREGHIYPPASAGNVTFKVSALECLMEPEDAKAINDGCNQTTIVCCAGQSQPLITKAGRVASQDENEINAIVVPLKISDGDRPSLAGTSLSRQSGLSDYSDVRDLTV